MSLPWKTRAVRPVKTPDPILDHVRRLVTSRSRGRCELCQAAATDLHHRQRRDMGDHSAGNLLHLCRLCHRRIHSHVTVSQQNGWIVRTHDDPYDIPVLLDEQLWMFRFDGGTSRYQEPDQ